MIVFNRTINWLAAMSLAFIIAIVTVFALSPALARLEPMLFPVTTRLEIRQEAVRIEDGIIEFYVKFDKKRQCDFLGIAWYRGDERLVLKFEASSSLSPATRIVGPQFTGPWQLSAPSGFAPLTTMKGTKARVLHRCHPIWTTITQIYP
jgi:hypothetical protein